MAQVLVQRHRGGCVLRLYKDLHNHGSILRRPTPNSFQELACAEGLLVVEAGELGEKAWEPGRDEGGRGRVYVAHNRLLAI